MAWTALEKKGFGRGNRSPLWRDVPAISVGKSTITFNRMFDSAFLSGRRSVLVFIDRDSRRIGLKVPSNADNSGAFKVSEQKGKSDALIVNARGIQKAFPDAIGYAFRAHLNSSERVIEIDLSQSNRI